VGCGQLPKVGLRWRSSCTAANSTSIRGAPRNSRAVRRSMTATAGSPGLKVPASGSSHAIESTIAIDSTRGSRAQRCGLDCQRARSQLDGAGRVLSRLHAVVPGDAGFGREGFGRHSPSARRLEDGRPHGAMPEPARTGFVCHSTTGVVAIEEVHAGIVSGHGPRHVREMPGSRHGRRLNADQTAGGISAKSEPGESLPVAHAVGCVCSSRTSRSILRFPTRSSAAWRRMFARSRA
jgi:hypothetical protein